jgi:hypothetical protein
MKDELNIQYLEHPTLLLADDVTQFKWTELAFDSPLSNPGMRSIIYEKAVIILVTK